MSRCFPYPPPCYWGKVEAPLIDNSIKLQREREKSQAERKKEESEKKNERRERKEKKREEKERKREEKRKSEVGKNREKEKSPEGQDICFGEKAHEALQTWVEPKQEQAKNIAELVERSDLTEEHELPARPQQPCNSSESTDGSNKRKRHASPTPRRISAQGNIIRFRPPLKKHQESSLGNEILPSSGVRTSLPVIDSNVLPLPETGILGSSAPGAGETISKAASDLSSFYQKLQRRNRKYEDLFRSWVAPVLQTHLSDSHGDEWLFAKKNQTGEKRLKVSSGYCCGQMSMLQPRAQYLPEADVIAMPFTVPF